MSFQLVSFLVPWFALMWLSNNEDIKSVADFSLLLALITPIALLLACPSRNYLLSQDRVFLNPVLKLRLILSILGLLVTIAYGMIAEVLLLSVALFVCKNFEYYYDLPITAFLKQKNDKKLFLASIRKVLLVLIALLVTMLTDSLETGLIVLGVMFFLDAIRATEQVRPTGEVASIFSTSFSVALSALLFSIYFFVPRYILGLQGLENELAIFTVSSFLLMLVLVVLNTACQTMMSSWREALKSSKAVMKIYAGSLLFIVALYVVLQLFHLAPFRDFYWGIHDNIHENDPSLITTYHLVLVLSFGSLLFSYSNYLLILIQEGRFLLLLTFINTVFCGAFGWLFSDYLGMAGLLGMVAISGIVHFIVSSFRLWKYIHRASV
uniref:hypothetical protein n=1 Tax=Ningiella ruwaisensis TaxID=2364274 RepID=UPI0010A06501|nr:hypothetical protein [Ningiella ruwaisensis]